MKILNLVQGKPEWDAHRAHSRNASEAPVVMGTSKLMLRDELVKTKAIGGEAAISWFKERLFEKGHEVENSARVILEAEIGDDLYPVVATSDDGYLSASVDGMTMDGTVLFEHKIWNKELAQAIRDRSLSAQYYWQLEQQLLVTGASKVIFVCSDGTVENREWMEYAPVAGRAELLIQSWKQFDKDVAAYQPEVIEVLDAKPTKINETLAGHLPVLFVKMTGEIRDTNIEDFKNQVISFVDSFPTKFETDDDFYLAKSLIKTCSEAEEQLEQIKTLALSQTRSIDDFFGLVNSLKEMVRQKRLAFEKITKKNDDQIKFDIINECKVGLMDHLTALNEEIGLDLMPPIEADFVTAIKRKQNVSSMRGAVQTCLANAKVQANMIKDVIVGNLTAYNEQAGEYEALFPDLEGLVLKAPGDFTAILKARISDHKEAEAKRKAEEEAARKEQEEARKKAEEARIEAEKQRAQEAEDRARAQEIARIEAEKARIEAEKARAAAEQARAEAYLAQEKAKQEAEETRKAAERARKEAETMMRQAAEATAKAEKEAAEKAKAEEDGGDIVDAYLKTKDFHDQFRIAAILREFVKFQKGE